MNAIVNALTASINEREVGTVREEGGFWSFEYASSWQDYPQAFDLAPNLPRTVGKIVDASTRRPVQWFFDNLLPEEGARELLAREAQTVPADAFGLLAYYGRESAGAIVLLPPGESPQAGGYVPLSDQELHERISRLPRHSLAAGAPKRMSLAGAQHKLAVCLRDGKLFHPVADTPSTHILKPDHRDTDLYPQSVINEYFCMRLAARIGLDVPAVELRYVPDPVYLVERFDRHDVDGQTKRIHTVDACQLLGLDRSFKYSRTNGQSLAQCIELCSNKAQTRRDILAWVLFNLLIGNGDAHLKNLSFLVDGSGIRLAPFYDLLSTECYRAQIGNVPRWPQTPLTLSVGGAETFAAADSDAFTRFAVELGSTARAAARLRKEFCGKLAATAAGLHEQIERRASPVGIQRAAELRALSMIRFIVIKDMTQRLVS